MTVRKLLTFTLAALIVAAAAGRRADARDDKDDKKAFEGTWVVQSAEEAGQPQGELDKARFTFKEDKLSIKLKDEKDATELTFKLDATKKTIDITPANEKAAVGEGLYEISGDTLKLCVADVGVAKRPGELKAKEKGVTLITLKKEK
jgi:uncharacterized protein (TIGR03067 family)